MKPLPMATYLRRLTLNYDLQHTELHYLPREAPFLNKPDVQLCYDGDEGFECVELGTALAEV